MHFIQRCHKAAYLRCCNQKIPKHKARNEFSDVYRKHIDDTSRRRRHKRHHRVLQRNQRTEQKSVGKCGFQPFCRTQQNKREKRKQTFNEQIAVQKYRYAGNRQNQQFCSRIEFHTATQYPLFQNACAKCVCRLNRRGWRTAV